MQDKTGNNQNTEMTNNLNTNRTEEAFMEEETCSICICEFENDDKVIITSCSHLFHEQCLTLWIKNSIDKCTRNISARDTKKVY